MSDRFKNYVSVAERLNEAVPDIQTIVTEPPVMLTDAMGYIRATVALKDGCTATGIASFRLDLQGKSAQATNPLEDSETSAVGRALGFLGYSSNRSIATREEVIEAQRRSEPASYNPPAAQPATNGAEAANARVKFYEHWGAVAGSHWGAVQGFLATDMREPTTVDDWRLVWKRVKAEVDQRDLNAIDAAEKAA